jgi:site-specific recombinase XerD
MESVSVYFESVFQELDGAYAPSTLHGYRKDIQRISKWVLSHGCDPAEIDHPELVDYLENGCHGLAMATIKRSVAALGTIYKYAELHDPTKHPKVQLALRRLGRQRGNLQAQAKPLTNDLLQKLLALCDPNTTVGLRNQVLLYLGYETMRRRGELVRFRFDDLRESANGSKGILLRSSKTDQMGYGKIIPISDGLNELITRWAEQAGTGYILRGIRKGNSITDRLAPESVNRILKRLEMRTEKRTKTLSGHSFRVGKTIDLVNEGLSVEQIAIRGGWTSSEVVFRYAQSWNQSNTKVYQ